MSSSNLTGFTPLTLVLIGIPGLEVYQIWFAAPVLILYVVTVLGNCSLLVAIRTVLNLHKPMYVFISQLAFSDLVMSSSIIPKMFAIFWFNDGEVSFIGCLLQTFFTQCFITFESSILSVMAADRYVAVCNPLRYSVIVTNSVIAKVSAVSATRASVIPLPVALVTMTLPFCSRHIAHSYCENMAVAKLACSAVTFNSGYVLAIFIVIALGDLLCIASSYILILRTIVCLPHKDRFKAFSTCTTHVCVMFVFYLPILCSIVLHRSHHNIPLYVHVIVANTHLLLPPFINPFIYGVIMKEVQQGMLHLCKKLKSGLALHD